MTRIEFTDQPSGNSYTVPINPNKINPEDSTQMNLIGTLDGAPVRSVSTFDDRVRTLHWPYYPLTNTTFTGMVSVLKGYKGSLKRLHLHDIDAAFSFGYRNIRIIDVATDIPEGGDLRQNLIISYVYTTSY